MNCVKYLYNYALQTHTQRLTVNWWNLSTAFIQIHDMIYMIIENGQAITEIHHKPAVDWTLASLVNLQKTHTHTQQSSKNNVASTKIMYLSKITNHSAWYTSVLVFNSFPQTDSNQSLPHSPHLMQLSSSLTFSKTSHPVWNWSLLHSFTSDLKLIQVLASPGRNGTGSYYFPQLA